jgi:CheY-like chemotaxis protein
LLATLRQNPLTKQIKAIVLTTMGENSQPYYAIGADLCLSKPIAPDHLLQQIIRLTATARSA